MQDYHGKAVAITGAANGIGQELARRFAAAGAQLALADIDADHLDALVKELEEGGAQVLSAPYSMGNGAAIKRGARAARGQVVVFMDADGQHDHMWDTVVPTFLHYNLPLICTGWIAAMVL